MSSGLEFTTVESPFTNQLIGMGWKLVTGNLDQPSVTGRETLRRALIKSDLHKAIERINLRDGKPWLDEARISHAVSALEVAEGEKLSVMEDRLTCHVRVTGLLAKGTA
jgi:type I restriction enzyme R subunit